MRLLAVVSLFFCLGAVGAHAKEVKIGMGNFEPYYIVEGETGIFTDLLKAVFKLLPGYEPKFLFGRPNKRMWHEFETDQIDAVSNLFDSVKLDGCRSDPVFRFHDVAVTKKSSGIKLEKVSDLADKRIISFQGANQFFGDEFASMTDFPTYTEVGKPEIQSKMLYLERADVSIGDLLIFLRSVEKTQKPKMRPDAFVFHEIFPAVYSRMGFRDADLCKRFNIALKTIQESGEYEQIYNGYLKKLGYVE
jgi:polar amino acid transport system substrate-binding protein